MKKSFTLLSTIVLLTIFASLSIYILETKSIENKNLQNQYLYIQGKNHLEFLEEYVKSRNDLSSINKLEITNEKFLIYSLIKKNQDNYEIDLYVKSKLHSISLYKKIFK